MGVKSALRSTKHALWYNQTVNITLLTRAQGDASRFRVQRRRNQSRKQAIVRVSSLQCQRLFWCGAAGRQPHRFEPSSRSVTAGKTGRCTYKDGDGDMILAIDEESGAYMTDPDSGTGSSSENRQVCRDHRRPRLHRRVLRRGEVRRLRGSWDEEGLLQDREVAAVGRLRRSWPAALLQAHRRSTRPISRSAVANPRLDDARTSAKQ